MLQVISPLQEFTDLAHFILILRPTVFLYRDGSMVVIIDMRHEVHMLPTPPHI